MSCGFMWEKKQTDMNMLRIVYLSLDLDLSFQPVAAVLSVPQGLRNGPQLSCNRTFLLRDLLELKMWRLFHLQSLPSSHQTAGTHQELQLKCWRVAVSYLGAELMEVVVSLLDLVHAALQVSVQLHPLRLQTTPRLVRPTLTCQDDCFLSNKRKKNAMKDGESVNRLFNDEKNC